jgi:DNA-directed RNA polymerase subunit N
MSSLPPMRCFSCGKVIADLFVKYEEQIKTENPEIVFANLKITRFCCRRMFVSYVSSVENYQLLISELNHNK